MISMASNIDETCGFHVHHGVDPMSVFHLQATSDNWSGLFILLKNTFIFSSPEIVQQAETCRPMEINVAVISGRL